MSRATAVGVGAMVVYMAVQTWGAELLSSRARVQFLTQPNWSETPDEADARQLVDETIVTPNGHWMDVEMVGWRGVEVVRLDIILNETETLGALELELPVGHEQDVKPPRTAVVAVSEDGARFHTVMRKNSDEWKLTAQDTHATAFGAWSYNRYQLGVLNVRARVVRLELVAGGYNLVLGKVRIYRGDSPVAPPGQSRPSHENQPS